MQRFKPTDALLRMRAFIAIALVLCAGYAAAAFPDKPVRLIASVAPGGLSTTYGNILCEFLAPALGQRAVLDYKPGANGNIGATYVAHSAPDGYTLLLAAKSTMVVNTSIYPKAGFDPVKDFTPVAMVALSGFVLAVHADSPYKSVDEMIAAVKKRPGALSYGSSGNGSTPHMTGELFKAQIGAQIEHISYKGIGPALVALLGKQVDFVFSDVSITPHFASGRLRALAVTTAERMTAFPTIPTMVEQSVKGFVVDSWIGVFAPTSTPKAVVDRLESEIAKGLAQISIRARFVELGAEPSMGSRAAYLESNLQTEIPRRKRIIDMAGISVD